MVASYIRTVTGYIRTVTGYTDRALVTSLHVTTLHVPTLPVTISLVTSLLLRRNNQIPDQFINKIQSMLQQRIIKNMPAPKVPSPRFSRRSNGNT